MRHTGVLLRRSLFVVAAFAGTLAAACSSTAPRSNFTEADSGGDAYGGGPVVDNDAFAPKGNCNGAPETSITGIVYDPAGVTPLYNVIVYIPNEKVEPFPSSETTQIFPRWFSTIFLQVASPIPVPEYSC